MSGLLLRLPALPESVPRARHAVRELCARLGVDPVVASDVELAVTEACSNVVLHAYPASGEAGGLELLADLREGELEVVVRDQGIGVERRADSPGLGIGLTLIRKVASRMEVRGPDDRRWTEVAMWFPPQGRRPRGEPG